MILAWLSWLICTCCGRLRPTKRWVGNLPHAVVDGIDPDWHRAPVGSPSGRWLIWARRCRSVADRFTPIPMLWAPPGRWLAGAASP